MALSRQLTRARAGERCVCGLMVRYGELDHEESPTHKLRITEAERDRLREALDYAINKAEGELTDQQMVIVFGHIQDD